MNDLRERGWTDRLVRTFLGNADRSIPNPYLQKGRPKRLFSATRVLEIETRPDFLHEKGKSADYSIRRKGAADTKRETLEALVNSIELPPLTDSLDIVMERVRQQRVVNPHLRIRSESWVALEDLLGTMKSLDWHLDAFAWHPGIRTARKLLRTRMLAHIVNHYPTLAQVAQERAAQEEGNAEEW